MTPKKTQEMKNEDDDYAGSTDMDEPGVLRSTLKGQFSLKSETHFPSRWFWCE